jgi:hypothetical protein
MRGIKRPKYTILPQEALVQRQFTHELVRDEPYYLAGPQQGRPSDGNFRAGTKVVLMQEEGDGFARVADAAGVNAVVSIESLRKLSAGQ